MHKKMSAQISVSKFSVRTQIKTKPAPKGITVHPKKIVNLKAILTHATPAIQKSPPGRTAKVKAQNSVQEISKQIKASKNKDIRTSEERELAHCTFKPNSRQENVTKESKSVTIPPSENKRKQLLTLKRIVGPDQESKSLLNSLSEGTFVDNYSSKTPRALQHLLHHGYSFTFEEKRLQLSADRSSKARAEVRSRLMSPPVGAGKASKDKRAESVQGKLKKRKNSDISYSSFIQELTGKDQQKSIGTSNLGSKSTVIFNESARMIFQNLQNPELAKIKSIHSKYVPNKYFGQRSAPASPQRGDNSNKDK